MNRYVFGVLATVILLISAIVLIVTGGPDSDTPAPLDQVTLTDYTDTAATVRLTVQGEIEGEDSYEELRIAINRNTRTIEHVQGYTGQVVRQKSFSNTDAAFDVFLNALAIAGFNNEQDPDFDDVTGVCPFGNRFILRMTQDGEELVDLWATSCDRDDGSFGGDLRATRRLFEQQIPEYRDFEREVNL